MTRPSRDTRSHPLAPATRWVERAQLAGYLSRPNARLILISAPAGFGKTTLIAQWRAELAHNRAFAWINMDSGDNDPGRLWSRIISALNKSCPELAADGIDEPWRGEEQALDKSCPELAADGIDEPWRGEEQALAGTALPRLLNRLASLRTPVVLVLDNYQVINEPGCHQLIEFLVRHLPLPVQIVLATREEPPLPLARLRAEGKLAEVRARELCFTPSETAALVRAAGVADLGEHDLAELVKRTEGWPAGIYLAALSLRENPSSSAFIRQFSGTDRFVFDFLTEEAFNHQSPEMCQFLMRTSILERFTAPLCDAVADTSGAREELAALERANLFVVPMDSNRLWYRYHRLFAQMLRSRLAVSEPEIMRALHQRASAWHRQWGFPEEAVSHALAAGDTAEAVDLIARHWLALVSTGKTATVRRWIHLLGDARIHSDPIAAHCAAWTAALCGDQKAESRWLVAVKAGKHNGRLPDGMASLQSSAALLRGMFGFDGLRVMCRSAALAVKLEDDPLPPWYTLARTFFGFSLYLSGEPEAAAALEQAVLSGTRIPPVRTLALAIASVIAAEEGRLGQAEELAVKAQETAGDRVRGELMEADFVHTATGAIHYQQGRLQDARNDFERALHINRRRAGTSPWPKADILLRLAMVLAELGDRAGAATLLAEARNVLAVLPDGTQALQARAGRAESLLTSEAREMRLSEPLTEREDAVLHLLRGTLSIREIGMELHLSVNTIKTHTRSIYRKLGVADRRDAVERARLLDLIS
jgi:ATP/maltotriose-dependent transcriptional regulator MalT